MPQNTFAYINLSNKQQKCKQHCAGSGFAVVSNPQEALAAEANISDLATSVLKPDTATKAPR